LFAVPQWTFHQISLSMWPIATMPPNFSSTANEIWAVADLLRGDFKQSQYEIPFNRHFYTYSPPRPLDAIDTELAEVTGEIQELLQEVAGA
jgi:hypothetical protein